MFNFNHARGLATCFFVCSTVWLALHCGVASAQSAEDEALQEVIESRFGVVAAGEILGLSPEPASSLTGETSAFAANLSLKALAPVFSAPSGKDLQPNTSDQCALRYQLPQTEFEYEDLFAAWKIKPVPNDWGPFGRPSVFHLDTQVNVRVDGVEATDPDPNSVHHYRLLQEGEHQLKWRAETQISDFWDIYLPTFLLSGGILSETKRGGLFSAKAVGASAAKASALRRNIFDVVKNIGEAATIRGVETLEDGRLLGTRTTAEDREVQNIRVWDVHPPYYTDPSSGSVIQEQVVVLEATDFGGARFSRDRVQNMLQAQFKPVDDCGRELSLRADNPPSLLPINEQGTALDWLIQDQGPYERSRWLGALAPNQEFLTPSSEVLRTRLVQTVIVQDTQPPLLVVPESFARYADDDVSLTDGGFDLGQVRVSDLADPNPSVGNNAPESLGFGRHRIEYWATDFSGNTTAAPASNPDQYVQLVTIKPPNSNNAPTTSGFSTAARSGEVVTLELNGSDSDLLDGRYDPLTFRLVDRPQHGTFRASPLPFFIEDFRATPDTVPDGTSADALPCLEGDARRSGPALEAQLGLLDPNQHGDYVERCYCERSGADRLIPTDFVYRPDFVHVKDNGEYVVADKPLECAGSPSNDVRDFLRFSRWRNETLLAEARRGGPLGRQTTFDVDDLGRIWWNDLDNSGAGEEQLDLNSLDENFEPWFRRGSNPPQTTVLRVNEDSASGINTTSIVYGHADIERGLIYVNDKSRVYVFELEGDRIDRKAIGMLNDGNDFSAGLLRRWQRSAGLHHGHR